MPRPPPSRPPPAMRSLALAARKGGAGKTTLAVHLGVLAQQLGRRVLLVDTDPQRSLAGWWHRRESALPQLAEAEAGRLGRVFEAAAADGVELVVVDTRPSVEWDTAEVAKRCDFVLVPTRPAILDLEAIGATLAQLAALRRPHAVVLNACPPPRGAGEAALVVDARKALAGHGAPVAPVVVGARASLAHALIDGRAVTEFEPDGKAARELRALLAWLEDQAWPRQRAAARR